MPRRRSPPTTGSATWWRSHRPYKRIGVEKGDERRVVGIDHKAREVVLDDGKGGRVAWKPEEIGGRRGGSEVYRAEEIELRAGDHIRWTRNDAGLGLVNSRTAEVLGVANGRHGSQIVRCSAGAPFANAASAPSAPPVARCQPVRASHPSHRLHVRQHGYRRRPRPRSPHIAMSPCPISPVAIPPLPLPSAASLPAGSFSASAMPDIRSPLELQPRPVHRYAHGRARMVGAKRVLAARIAVATGRGCGAGGGTVPGGGGPSDGARHVGRIGGDGGRVAGGAGPLRPAAGARLPSAVAPALPARGVAHRDWPGGRDGRCVAGGGAASVRWRSPIYAIVLSLPVWAAWWWLVRRG